MRILADTMYRKSNVFDNKYTKSPKNGILCLKNNTINMRKYLLFNKKIIYLG